MKNKLIISVLLFCTLTSCTGWLEVAPADRLTRENFWQTKEDVLSAMVGIYSLLRDNVETYIYWGEVRGDLLASNVGRAGADKEAFDVFLVNPSNSMIQFVSIYRAINQCNLILKNIPDVAVRDGSFNDKLIKEYTAEARMLRAYCYFMLARTFKDVPIVTDPAERDDQNFYIPKSPQADVYSFVYDDINYAVDNLPQSYATVLETKTRCTYYAALAMRAEVALTMGYYDLAIQDCETIISSRTYYMLPGTDYLSIFYPPACTAESLWEFPFNKQLGQTSVLRNRFNSNQHFNGTHLRDLFSSEAEQLYGIRENASLTSGDLVNKYNVSTDDAHWILYRFADVLLMQAEAYAHTTTGNANDRFQKVASLVEMVAKRSLIQNDPENLFVFTVDPPLSVDEADDMILNERGRELCFEGTRWYDLVRFASRDNFARKYLLTDRVVASFNGIEQQSIAPRIANPESWYLPVSAADIVSNPALKQNPYYE